MRALQITELSGPDGALSLAELPDPDPSHMLTPGSGVIVDVHCAGVSFPEVLQTRGEYQLKPPLPFVPGSEVAGVVRSAPEGAQVKAGDRVAAFCALGGFAETVVAPEFFTFPLSSELDFAQGAGLVLNYHTALFALKRRGRLQEGETVLVHGAAGGLGTAACQLAAAYGARVIAVVSTPQKGDIARTAGAHEVVAVEGFREEVRRLTDGRGVSVVVDPVGGDRFTDSLRCLATEGRVIVIGFTGREIPTVRVNRLLLTNTAVMGAASEEFWHANPGFVGQQWRDLLPLMRSGAIDPPIGSVFALDDVASALRTMDERRAVGRLLVRVREDTTDDS